MWGGEWVEGAVVGRSGLIVRDLRERGEGGEAGEREREGGEGEQPGAWEREGVEV